MSAYRVYAGKVTPTALSVLVYMALVALDRDSEPKYWEGHEALAVHCLGRSEESIDDSDLRAVRRAVTSLFEAGAITVYRHSSPDREKPTVSYRLWLTAPAPDEKRPVNNRRAAGATPDGNRPVNNGNTGRKTAEHRTESDRTPDGNRPPKEYEEDKERDKTQEYSLPSSDSVPVGAREARDGLDESVPVRVIASPLMTVVPPDPVTCTYADCGTPQGPVEDGYHRRCKAISDAKTQLSSSGKRAQQHTEAS